MADTTIFAISDIHGETKFFERAADIMRDADLVIIAGDLTRTGNVSEAEKILSIIEQYNERILAVHGNWDKAGVIELLDTRGYSLHAKGRIIGGIGYFGVGGSSRTPMKTPIEYDEEKIEQYLSAGYRQIDSTDTIVLISHAPPRKVKDRTFLGLRGGSWAVRNFLEKRKVDLCLCGHIHEAHGSASLGSCMVVNSGSFRKGRHSRIALNDSITVHSGKLKL